MILTVVETICFSIHTILHIFNNNSKKKILDWMYKYFFFKIIFYNNINIILFHIRGKMFCLVIVLVVKIRRLSRIVCHK